MAKNNIFFSVCSVLRNDRLLRGLPTMNLALLRLLTLLLLGSTSGFELDKEYRYGYEGTIKISQPDIPAHAAGLAFRSEIVVQPQVDHTHFKIVNFQLDTVNKGAIDFDAHEFAYRSSSSMTEHIERPFAVKFANGKFENIELKRNEPLWSQNMKRALASLFQVDLAGRRDHHVKEYSTFEESISGNCETLYVLSDDLTDGREGHFKVAKVRNMENCTYTSRALYGSFRGKKCQSCGSKEAHPLILNADAEYELSGTPADFVIVKAVGTASHVFNPIFGGKVVEMYERRALNLIEVAEPTTDTTTSDDLELHTTLGEEQPVSTSLRDREDLSKSNAFLVAYNVTLNKPKFQEYFDSLADLHYGKEDLNDALQKLSPAQRFMGVYHTFFGFNYDETAHLLESTLKRHQEEVPPPAEGQIGEEEAIRMAEEELRQLEQEEARRSLFLDLLSASGANQHISLAINMINNSDMNIDEAKAFITKLPFNVLEPSEAVLHGVIDLCELPFVEQHERLKGACLLALGSLIEGNCQRAGTDDQEDGGFCKPEIVGRVFNHNVGPADVTNQSHYLSGVYAEVNGKLATRPAVRQMARFAEPHVDCQELRLGALWGLARAGSKQPQLVRQVVLPIFTNTSESHPIRIAAFVAVAATHPDLYLLRHIARGIISDPSDQVASYVTSFFREMAKSKHPCHVEWTRKLEYVVPIWDDVSRFDRTPSHTESRFTLWSTYNEKYNYYGAIQTSIIMSEDSYLPLSIHRAQKDCISGFCFDSLSLTYQGYGLDRVYDAMVSPRTGTKYSLWNFFGRRRTTRGAEERQRIDNSLPITPRDFKPFSARVKITVWGHTVETWDLEETLADFFKEPATRGTNMAHRLISLLQRGGETKRFFLTPVMLLQIPTDVGLPAFVELKQTNFFYVNRQPATFEQDDDKFMVDFQRHYLMDTYHYTYFGFGLPFDQAYVGAGYEKRLALSLPFHARATYDLKTHRLKLERSLDKVPFDVLNYYFKPYSAFGYYNDTISVEDYGLPTTYNDEELTWHNRTYFADTLGYGYEVKSRLFTKDLKKSLQHFWHDMDLAEKGFYLDVNPHWHPRHLSIRIVPAEEDATHTIEVDIGYNVFGQDAVETRNNIASVEGTPGNLSSHILNVDVSFKGNKSRSVRTELQVTHTRDFLKHWVRFVYDRSPFRDGESNHTKVCLDTAVTFPEPDWQKADNLATFYQGNKIEAKADLAYGADCSQGSRIHLDGTYEHTDADAEEIEDIVSGKPRSKNRFKQNILRKLYDKCFFYQQRGIPYSHFCIKYLYQSSRLGKLNLDVEYHNLKPLHRHYFRAFHHHSKKHPDFFDTIFSHLRGTDGKLHAVAQVPATRASRDCTRVVVTATDGRVFHHDHVPIYTHLLEPRVFQMLGYTNLQEYSTTYKHEYCDLQGHSIRTFDGEMIRLPSTDCYSVVTRDCSPGSHFVILVKDTESPTFPKALKLFFGNTVIDISQPAEESGGALRVNGETVPVPTDYPYSHVKDGAELFSVESNGHFFRINSNSHGVYLFFHGHILFVQVSPFYRGKLCGLCGDYNYERQYELRGSDKRLYNDTLEFAKSYVVPSEDCVF